MLQPFIKDGVLKLQPYSLAHLSTIYNVCTRTFKKWIKPFVEQIGKPNGRFYTVRQVRTVIESIGLPSDISIDA